VIPGSPRLGRCPIAILQIIDQLTDKLNSSPRVPLSNNRVVVDATEFAQLLDRLRINVPSSIRDSERTLAERERILQQADDEARKIVAQAQRRASELLAADHLVQAARREAERIVEDARLSAVRSAEEADAYAEYVLKAINDTLSGAGNQVTNGLTELSSRRAERAAQMSLTGGQQARAAAAQRPAAPVPPQSMMSAEADSSFSPLPPDHMHEAKG